MTNGRSLVTQQIPSEAKNGDAGNGTARRAILVNGRSCDVRSDDIGFEQVVRLAFAGEEPSHSRSLSVTYRRGPAAAAEGILAPMQRTPILDGETFIVTRTDKS